MTDQPLAIRRPVLTVPWWAIGVLAMWFALLGYVAKGPNTLQIDLSVSEWAQSFDGSVAASLAWIGDMLGERAVALGMLAVAWIGLALLGRRRDLWFVGLVAIGRVLGMPLKEWFNSPRPTGAQVELARSFDNMGFPSGHATTSAVLLGSAAFLLARHMPGRPGRLLLLATWILGMSLTAYARIWYGAHWLTDTLGGAAAGAIVILLAANLSATIAKEEPTARQ